MFKSTGLGFPRVRTHLLPLFSVLTCHHAFGRIDSKHPDFTCHYILFLPQMNKCQLNAQMETILYRKYICTICST
ncbi:hypothetical protein EUGRSUZ_J03125 [Eucalyptus grandis]|uniref:Uncharacterized protein n=2 Tax=Eucalyptus grandis TaxID=71139 RepID=A0A059AJB3_EUCGR|nr:hypothetical protein EUGRSUZ_J03125 [Eucalyptus grandis]